MERTLLIHPDMRDLDWEHGFSNVNGPSLVRVPEWVDDPLGKYYLYFAHHRGAYIRMAFADALEGPYTLYFPGSLHRDTTVFRDRDHIASPDVHIDEENRRFFMYFHGTYGRGQASSWATSTGGVDFTASDNKLDKRNGAYLRVFWWQGHPYATHHGWISRAETPEWTAGFIQRDTPLFPRKSAKDNTGFPRHTANHLEGDTLTIYYSLYGDSPERILKSTVQLTDDWNDWHPSAPTEVLAPKYDFEGVDLPIRPSTGGLDRKPVHELRDPAIYCEDGKTWLLYSVAGEQGIAITRL